ncbi:MAG: GNAT family N-acetyltransferase [Sphingomonadaceae bacterium]|nr:GNAT family N-acetyltransferase [Sphingomonadaceae bacterium]
MLPIRPATATDIPRLHELIERAYRGDGARAGWTHEADLLRGPRTDAASIAAIVRVPGRGFLVAEEAGAIVACVEVSLRGPIAYLGQLAVEPTRQASGLGRAMIAAAEAHARAHGATTMEMTVVDRRTELIAYYGRRGYVPTGEVRPFPPELIEDTPLSLVVLARLL